MKETTPTSTIGLFTDYGLQDSYVAQLKGAIKSIAPRAELIDLLHETGAFEIAENAYLLEKAVRYFPEGTVFVVVVDPGVGTDRKPIAVRTKKGHTLIAPDNGILTHILREHGVEAIREITHTGLFLSAKPSATFHGRDIFGPVAAHLASGTPFEEVGPELEEPVRFSVQEPTLLGNRISGQIVHIDRFGNIITNIRPSHLKEITPGTLVKIQHEGNDFSVPYVETYGDAPKDRADRPVALLNSDREFELAVPKGSAARYMSASTGQPLTITY